ncbi:MAG: sugar transferase [Bacteroidetes bacterium]|nr:sugar transferase [Bacteroidota bacterium]
MRFWGKRLFDIFFSLLGLMVLLPFFLVIALAIMLDSRGSILYQQVRVGLNGCHFKVLKFRTMQMQSDGVLNITVGTHDSRITRLGKVLRRFKLDELPQLVNVFWGEMSFVGPRPEVPKYVALYTPKQLQVLQVKPGITDYASIKYRNENALLAKASNPEQYYIDEVMPIKLGLNLFYVKNQSFILDIKLIIKTVIFIFVGD